LGEGDLETFRTLETLLESMQAWDGLSDVYHEEVKVLEQREPERRGAIWRRIAEIEGQHKNSPDAALEALRQVDAVDPLSCELLHARAELELSLGDNEAYVETRARWCDDPNSSSAAADHRALAQRLDDLGRVSDAAARIERAVSFDAADAEVWVLAAQLREKNDDHTGASQAYVRAAEASGGDEAAVCLGRAAALLEGTERAEACDLLDRAIDLSRRPNLALHARRVAVADALGRHADVLTSALCIQEAAPTQADVPERDELLRCFAAGARSSQTLERSEDAARLWGSVLELESDHEEALVGSAASWLRLESWAPAREALENLLDLPGRDGERAQNLCELGIVLERLHLPSEAADRYRLALDLDPSREVASEGWTRALRDAERLDECFDALLDRADHPGCEALRADRLLQAAEIAIELDRSQEALQHLCSVREARPEDPRAWLRGVELLAGTGDEEAAEAVASEGLERLEDPEARAELALGKGRRLEARGQTRAAAEMYGLAAELDASRVPAALGATRTLLSLGEPERASKILSDFLDASPNDDAGAAATVWLAAGDLRAGPMNDAPGAAEAYRRALELAPELEAARDALAALLVRMPDSRDESLSLHEQILAERPTDLPSLRGLLALAEAEGDSAGVANGLAILTGLGAASPEERERSDGRLKLAVDGATRFEDALWDRARRLLDAGSKLLVRVLDSAAPMEGEPEDSADRFRRAAMDAEAGMTTAGCVALDDAELRELVVALAELASGSDVSATDRAWAAPLADAVGSIARRRLKRGLASNSPSEIAGIDFSAWRRELRRMARARALDATEGDLRAAFVALLSEWRERTVRGLDPESDMTALVGHCPASRALMRDVALSWARSLSLGQSRKGGSRDAA
ncbi:MAG: tetratricopeptide repeat protein, partial [Myxococcota bacterium]